MKDPFDTLLSVADAASPELRRSILIARARALRAVSTVTSDNVMSPSGIQPGVAVDDDETPYDVLVNNADTISTLFDAEAETDSVTAAEALPTTFAASLRHLDALTAAIPMQEGDEDETDTAFAEFRDSIAELRGAVDGMMAWAHKLKELALAVAPTKEPKFPAVPKANLPAAEVPKDEDDVPEVPEEEAPAEEEEPADEGEGDEEEAPADEEEESAPETLDEVAELL